MKTQGDTSIYILGAFLALAAGLLDLQFGDLMLTALFVLAASMLLGALRPPKPWRWMLIVAAGVPLVRLAAFLVLHQRPYRAQIYESCLGFLTGTVGAYAGSVGRSVVKNILGTK